MPSAALDPLAPLRHPAAWHQAGHMLLAAFAATGFLVAGIHAWMLLREPHSRFHRLALKIALVMGGVPALLQPLSGDLIAKSVAAYQPAKLAAMEALFRTKSGADFVLGGIPDSDTRTLSYAVLIPHGLSVLLHHDMGAEVTGLDRFAEENWPPVAVVHIAFQLMVACGMLMAALACWAGWHALKRRRLEDHRTLLYALIGAAPLGFIAIEAGWVVTEVGRQPWIIYEVMRTSDAVTPMPGLWVPMATFSFLYVVLAGVVCWAMWRHVAAAESPVLLPAAVKEPA
jgi:cytochrome d ubiquinol oxidase subunit I